MVSAINELLIYAIENYKGYFSHGQKVLTYNKDLNNSLSGIKLNSNDYLEIEDAFNKLRVDGILLLVSELSINELNIIFKDSQIKYINNINYIVIK